MNDVFSGVVVAVCVVLLARIVIGPHRRASLDAALLRTARRLRGAVADRRVPYEPPPTAEQEAERLAREAIRRARRRDAGDWNGNVYTPRSIDDRKRKDKLH